MRSIPRTSLVAALCICCAAPSAASAAGPRLNSASSSTAGVVSQPQEQPIGTNAVVSVHADGSPVRSRKNRSSATAVNESGRYVAFTSSARGLVQGHGSTHNHNHFYLRDRDTEQTTLLDARPDGRFGNSNPVPNWPPSISADGRLVAFSTEANNLVVPGGRKRTSDVFVRDVDAGTTTMVTRAFDGGDANGESDMAQLSGDGSTIVFGSLARNLIADGPRRKTWNVYRTDRLSGETTLVSAAPDGGFPRAGTSWHPAVSADGTLIVYETTVHSISPIDSPFPSLVLYDAVSGEVTPVSRTPTGEPPDQGAFGAKISADGSTVVYISGSTNIVDGDDNRSVDVFAYDVASGETTLVSVSATGAFADNSSDYPSVSGDGSIVTFASRADDLVPGDDNGFIDVFVRDRDAGTTTLVSARPNGKPSNGDSEWPAISANGAIIAYESWADDLVRGLNEDVLRVFAYRTS